MSGEGQTNGFSIAVNIETPVGSGTEAILVEGDEGTRRPLTARLLSHGFAVRSVGSGLAALTEMADRLPALTIIRHGTGGAEEFDRVLALAVMLYPRSRIILSTTQPDEITDCPYPLLKLPTDAAAFDQLLADYGCIIRPRIPDQH